MTTNDIRIMFLEYYREKGHEVVASDSLVPKDDPTLLFTGAGMNQFKEKFLGRGVTFKRAASSQKCLRTGDLENVGRTSGHHTFFEMLGNFSFGDYFKKDAILWAWEFLVNCLQLTVDRLWVSVYSGDKEAYDIWKDVIRIPSGRIIKFGAKENFWPSEAPAKGPNGPCGPCSEIYFDYGKDVGCKKTDCSPACDCGRFVEVWNLVFTQFDRQPDGSLKPLPSKNIDTGMGLERLASVIQGVKTNFEIDIFAPITYAVRSGIRNPGSETDDRRRVNAIADHIRAVTFCIADGVMPSNEERGYVVRKLIRRAMSHGKDLGIKEPFLYKLVTNVVDAMGLPYPELTARRDDIAAVVKKEEESFQAVIDTQLPKVDAAFVSMRSASRNDLARAAFSFYDTYGMPYEMLEEIAQRYGMEIDRAVFDTLLEKQRDLSRSKTKLKGEIFSETFAKKIEALGLVTEFLGHDESHAQAKVLAVLDGGEVVLDKTPFYGESGGQVGDWGTIETPSGVMEVEDAKKIGATIVHICRIIKGAAPKVGEMAKVTIDEETRRKVMANHTATHLLQSALRKVLGEHVRQTGSLVDAEHLRFDFTHMHKMSQREIERVEQLVNDSVKSAIVVTKEIKDIESAKSEGAIALFGEKYGKKVRVVTVAGISKEFCGGTHVDNTKEIEIFKIIGESSIASGVRRIEALTGQAANRWIDRQKEEEESKAKLEKEKEGQKKHYEARLKEEACNIDMMISRAKSLGGSKAVVENIKDINMEGLRMLSDRIKDRAKSAVIVLSTVAADKASFVTAVTEDLVKKGLTASFLAKEVAMILDGSGGGKPGFAQGGGKDPSKLDAACNRALEIIKEKLS